MFENEPPARRAALMSREYVQSKNREGWLSLYAEDAIIEDPIGVSMIDPAGKGHRGAAAREAFWDNFIAPSDINVDILDSYAAGNEVANHAIITTTIEGGDGSSSSKRCTACLLIMSTKRVSCCPCGVFGTQKTHATF